MLSIRIVTSDSCPKCKFYIKALARQKYKFEKYDADAKSNQKRLDTWRITNMPVVQIIEHQKNAEPIVWFQFGPGQVSPRAIEVKKKSVMKAREKKLAEVEKLRLRALEREAEIQKQAQEQEKASEQGD